MSRPLKRIRPPVGVMNFGEHVEAGGLARAIRPDERVDRPAPHPEVDIADRAENPPKLLLRPSVTRTSSITHSRRPAAAHRVPLPTTAKPIKPLRRPLVKTCSIRGALKLHQRICVRPVATSTKLTPVAITPARLCSRRSQSSAWRRSRRDCRASASSQAARRIRSALATMAAGSPARRGRDIDLEIDARDPLHDLDHLLDRSRRARSRNCRRGSRRRRADRRARPDARRSRSVTWM